MSLKLNEHYPGRFNNPSSDYPQGSFKNRTTPTAKDGSYLEEDWANDKEGFFQSLLSAAGVTANGLVDKVGASQYFDALTQVTRGRFLNVRVFNTAGTFTYTPTTGTNSVVVEVVGGGGGGGGCQANGASASSAGGGGGSGAYGRGLYTSAFSGVTVTVGAGGAAGGAGGTGGSSSFGSLLSSPGGLGGNLGLTTSTFPLIIPGGSRASAPSGGNIISATGTAGLYGLALSTLQVASGFGAASMMGGGPGAVHTGISGNFGGAPGAGGGGSASQASGASFSGGAGAAGIVIVWEYA